jgi:hypothetical protein
MTSNPKFVARQIVRDGQKTGRYLLFADDVEFGGLYPSEDGAYVVSLGNKAILVPDFQQGIQAARERWIELEEAKWKPQGQKDNWVKGFLEGF